MLHGLGIETGVDLEPLVATSVWMAGQLGRPSPSPSYARSRVASANVPPRRLATTMPLGTAMSRVVYLHVGAPKTGTTYLQDRLASTPRRWPSTACTIPASARRARHCSTSAPRSTCSTRSGAARPGTPRASGTRWSSGYDGRRHRRSSATRSCAGAKPEQVATRDDRPRRQRGPPRLLRPRPGPPAPGRVAGGDQAGPQWPFRRFLDQGRARRRPWFFNAHATCRDVLSQWAREPAARARARGDRAARPRRAAATSCGCASAGPSASTRPGRPLESERDNVSLGIAETDAAAPAQPPPRAGRPRREPAYDAPDPRAARPRELVQPQDAPGARCRPTRYDWAEEQRRALDRLDQGHRRRRRR